METAPTKLLLSMDEVAESLGCGKTHAYSLIADGHIKSVKIGRLRKVPSSELERYVQALLDSQD